MAWLWWAGTALMLLVIEMVTVDLIFLMLAGGAVAAMITALIGGGLWPQVITFAVVAVILLFAARPPLKSWMLRKTPTTRTNARALIGRQAVVVQDVSGAGGRVKLAGEVWSARTDTDELVATGSAVTVTSIDGAIAVVRPTPAAQIDITD